MKNKAKFTQIFLTGFIFFTAIIILLPNRAQLQVKPLEPESAPLINGYTRDGNPKMEYVLYQLVKIYFNQGVEEAKKFAQQRAIDMQGDSVRVVAEAKAIKTDREVKTSAYIVSNQIELLGGRVETTYRQLVQSIVPIYTLEDLANFPSLEYLRLPRKPICLITSEGVSKTGADEWQSITPYRSNDVAKVCILDLGFSGYQALLGTELPSSVKTKSFRSDGYLYTGKHGTACAEIVHDMAPDAKLWLVNFSTDVEHHNAVDWIISQGVDIISYSIGWYNWGPGDGTGPICDDVKKASDNGIIWVSAAGNSAENHWEGKFRDPNSNRWCNFEKPGMDVSEWFYFYVYKGDLFSVLLSWDDWGSWNGSYYSGSQGNDYDLYLYNDGYQLIASSLNNQFVGLPPTEQLTFVAGYTGWLYIRVHKWWAMRNCKLELFFMNGYWLEHQKSLGSLTIPADSPYALAVGATDWRDDTYEYYSSQGPTSDGRVKPDLAAPSGVSCNTYGYYGFSGTSAAAPHVAGAFALLKGKTPYSIDQIKAILEARANDLGPRGKDNKFGHGRLELVR